MCDMPVQSAKKATLSTKLCSKEKENTGKHIIKPFNSPIDNCFSSGQVEPHGGVYHVNI